MHLAADLLTPPHSSHTHRLPHRPKTASTHPGVPGSPASSRRRGPPIPFPTRVRKRRPPPPRARPSPVPHATDTINMLAHPDLLTTAIPLPPRFHSPFACRSLRQRPGHLHSTAIHFGQRQHARTRPAGRTQQAPRVDHTGLRSIFACGNELRLSAFQPDALWDGLTSEGEHARTSEHPLCAFDSGRPEERECTG